MKKYGSALFLFTFIAVTGLIADSAEGLWKSVDEKTGKVTGAWKYRSKKYGAGRHTVYV